MTQRRRVGRALARHEGWLSITVSTTSAISFSIYTGVLTAGAGPGSPPLTTRIHELSWANALFFAGLILAASQILLVILRGRLSRSQVQVQGDALCSILLSNTVRMLHSKYPAVTFRSLVTVLDRSGMKRVTVCGANILTDPELTLEVPREFGIAGQAFKTRSMQVGDLDNSNRSINTDGSVVSGIWPGVRCVLAFPMLSEDGTPFGTVNFDCDHTAADSGLGDREIQQILGSTAELACYLMRGYSKDGTARFPR